MKKIQFWYYLLLIIVFLYCLQTFCFSAINPSVMIETNLGNMVIELYPAQAPKTVDNFLYYVNTGFYNNLIFHRVISGFMIQSGGYYLQGNYIYTRTPTHPSIINESYNGLSNLRGTIAMARTADSNSATSQFFINQVDNIFLDRAHASDGHGYCVFGYVKEGMDVVDAIASVPTYNIDPAFEDFPYPPIIISSAYVIPCESKDCSNYINDSYVNLKDFTFFANQWGAKNCNSSNVFCGNRDLDYNGKCDIEDLYIFADNWLQ